MIGPSRSKQIFIIGIVTISCLALFQKSANPVTSQTLNILTPKIQEKIKAYQKLICGVYIKSSWLSGTVNINGMRTFPAASLIKVPIAIILLQEIDKGKISWDTELILKGHQIAQLSSKYKTRDTGKKVKLEKAFKLMLIKSDNTASNMIIDLLGGINSCNQKITTLGLKNTSLVSYIKRPWHLNKTSPYDLVDILHRVFDGLILSNKSTKILKSTLLRVENNSLIKSSIGLFTSFPHKSGSIGISVGDAGVIYFSRNKKIYISIIVERPFNDLKGKEVIREIGKTVYEELKGI